MYIMLGINFAKNGYRCIIPKNLLWPHADCFGQANNMQSIVNHIKEQFPDNKVLLIGHSSSTHVAFLSTYALPTTLNADRLLLISGVYDIVEHFKFETRRGVESLSYMEIACGGQEGFKSFHR
eukprot:UN02551